MIDFSGSPCPWPADAVSLWADCAARAARQVDLWTIPAPQGDEVIRAALAGLFGFDPDEVTIVASLRAAALTYARCFREILLERPTYPGLLPVFPAARVRLMSWDELTVTAPGGSDLTRPLLWLTSPCRNPDGATLSAAERSALQAKAASGTRVVVNASYAWFSTAPPVPGVDTVGSLHKLRGVGARIGWVAAPGYFDEALPELVGATPSRVWQRAWGLFLSDGGMTLLRDACLRPAGNAARAFRERLRQEHGLVFPYFDGPSALIGLAEGTGEDAALHALRHRGFLLVAGRHFHAVRPALRATFFGIGEAQAVALADEVARCGMVVIPQPEGAQA